MPVLDDFADALEFAAGLAEGGVAEPTVGLIAAAGSS
jgi:hypothetical protein